MDLYPINIVRLHILESGQFINRFIEDFENSGVNPNEDLIIKGEVEDLTLQMVTYNKALRQIKARAETVALQSLDLTRRRRFSIVKRTHSIYEFEDDALVSTAYRSIRVIIRKYKNIPTENYETESLSITNFITEVRNAKNNAMVTLNLNDAIDKLELANSAFKTMFNRRSSSNASTTKYDTFALRTRLFETYRNLAAYTHLLANQKKTPFYYTTLSAFNTGREYFADLLAHRKGIQKKRKLKGENLDIEEDLEGITDLENLL